MSNILDLTDPQAENTPRVGGKAANLATLKRRFEGNGVVVPGGFVLTVEAHDQVMAPVKESVEHILKVDPKDHNALECLHQSLQEALEITSLPPSLEDAIQIHMRNRGAVAVRSSATCEDGQAAAFDQHKQFV